MNDSKTVYVLKFPKRHKSFIKKLFNKRHQFIDNSTGNINIPKLMNTLVTKLRPKVNQNFIRNCKHTQLEFIEGIINVLSNNTYWSRSKETINGNYLCRMHKLYHKWNVYSCLYKFMSMVYFRERKFIKLKDLSVDSTFIRNLYGTELLKRNPNHKHKNGIKVSAIDDINGVPISIAIANGTMYDGKILMEHIDDTFIENNPKEVQNNNRYKVNILGDSHYGSASLHQELRKRGYKPITDINMANTKDPIKRKAKRKIKKNYKKVSSKRSIKEISFAWLHKYPKLDRFVEKKVSSYAGLLLLGLSLIVNKKINW